MQDLNQIRDFEPLSASCTLHCAKTTSVFDTPWRHAKPFFLLTAELSHCRIVALPLLQILRDIVVVAVVIAMPVLRQKPTSSVRFDNSTGFARPPKRLTRLQCTSTPVPAVVEEEKARDGEGEDQQSSSQEESEEEIVAPVTTELELRWLIDNDNENGDTASTTMRMTGWQQPHNVIADDNVLSTELVSIRQNCLDWCNKYISRRSEWASYSLCETNAEVSIKDQSERPYLFDLEYDKIATYRLLYERVRKLHYEGVKGVRVVLTSYIRLKQATPVQQASQSQPLQPPISSQRKRPRAETAAERRDRIDQTYRDVARVTGDFVDEIFQEWVCHDKNCLGYRRSCWRPSGDPNSHIQLTQYDLRIWSEQISAGVATVKECPPSLTASLLFKKVKLDSDRREQKKKSNSDQPQLPVIIIINPWGCQTSGPNQTLTTEPRSSPPFQPGKDLTNLETYIDWLVKEGKVSKQHSITARTGLLKQGFGFNSLRDVTDLEWNEMGVPRGVRLAVLRYQKTWQRHLVDQKLVAARRARDEVLHA